GFAGDTPPASVPRESISALKASGILFRQRVSDNAFHLRRYRSATRTHLINRNSLRADCLQRSSSMHVVVTGSPSACEKPDRTIYEMTSIEYPSRTPSGPLPFCPAKHRLRRGRNGRSRVFFP